MSEESNAPAWFQAIVSAISAVITSLTYRADSSARKKRRSEDERSELQRAAFDLYVRSRTWLRKVSAALREVPGQFDWVDDPRANHMAGVVYDALDPSRHHVYPNGREIEDLTKGTEEFFV